MNKHLPHSVYLIHGWAANGRIFDGLRPLLPETWRVHTPDLPGHGNAPSDGTFDIIAAADALAAEMPDNSDVAGWSLGGLVALHLAIRYPHKVRRLCLTSSFAKFLATTDYPQGLNRSALDKMIALFEQDYPKYMRQFLQLQLLNTPDGEEIIASVLPDMVKNGAPAVLKAALDSHLPTHAPSCAKSASPSYWFTAGKTASLRRAWANTWNNTCRLPNCRLSKKRHTPPSSAMQPNFPAY